MPCHKKRGLCAAHSKRMRVFYYILIANAAVTVPLPFLKNFPAESDIAMIIEGRGEMHPLGLPVILPRRGGNNTCAEAPLCAK